MRHVILGSILEITLDPGESLFSPMNAMLWMDPGIAMTSNRGEGLFAGLKRTFGDYAFMVEYAAREGGRLALAPRLAGAIVPISLTEDRTLLCRKEVLLCAERSVQAKIDPDRRLGSLKRDDGSLWRLTGLGAVFLGIPGQAIERDLALGERLCVSSMHIAMLDASIGIRLRYISGFDVLLAGQDGLCVADLTGPGRVILQGAPVVALAEDIGKLLPSNN